MDVTTVSDGSKLVPGPSVTPDVMLGVMEYLCGTISPGPWVPAELRSADGTEFIAVQTYARGDAQTLMFMPLGEDGVPEHEPSRNREFMMIGRAAVPVMVAEIRRLRAEVKAWEEAGRKLSEYADRPESLAETAELWVDTWELHLGGLPTMIGRTPKHPVPGDLEPGDSVLVASTKYGTGRAEIVAIDQTGEGGLKYRVTLKDDSGAAVVFWPFPGEIMAWMRKG